MRLWFAFAPLRLRAALMLGLGAVGGAVITVWALAHHALTHDNATLAARTAAGHTFGVVVLVVVVLLAAAGYAAAVAMDRVQLEPRVRRRIGIALIAALSLVPIGGIVFAGELVARADRRGVARVEFADQHQRRGHRDAPAGWSSSPTAGRGTGARASRSASTPCSRASARAALGPRAPATRATR